MNPFPQAHIVPISLSLYLCLYIYISRYTYTQNAHNTYIYFTECSSLTEAKWALYICNHVNKDFVATPYHYTCGNSLWQLIITLWQLSGTP